MSDYDLPDMAKPDPMDDVPDDMRDMPMDELRALAVAESEAELSIPRQVAAEYSRLLHDRFDDFQMKQMLRLVPRQPSTNAAAAEMIRRAMRDVYGKAVDDATRGADEVQELESLKNRALEIAHEHNYHPDEIEERVLPA